MTDRAEYPWISESLFLTVGTLILQGLAIVHFIRRRPDTWGVLIRFSDPSGLTPSMVPPRRFRYRARTSVAQGFFAPASPSPQLEAASLTIRRGKLRRNSATLRGRRKLPAGASRLQTMQSPPAPITLDPFFYTAPASAPPVKGECRWPCPTSSRTFAEECDHDFYSGRGHARPRLRVTEKKKKARRSSANSRCLDLIGEDLNFASLLAAEGPNAEAREWAQKSSRQEAKHRRVSSPPRAPWFRRATRC